MDTTNRYSRLQEEEDYDSEIPMPLVSMESVTVTDQPLEPRSTNDPDSSSIKVVGRHPRIPKEPRSRVRTCSRSSVDMRTNWDSSGMYQSKRTSWKIRLLVILCGIIIIGGVVLIIYYHSPRPGRMQVGDSHITAEIYSDKMLQFTDDGGVTRLSISLGGDILKNCKFKHSHVHEVSPTRACFVWTNQNTDFCISQMPVESKSAGPVCFNLSWSFNSNVVPQDCVLFQTLSEDGNGQPVWYDTMGYIIWPKVQGNLCEKVCHEYVPTALKAVDVGGSVVEPLWLSSHGVILRASLKNHVKTCMDVCRDVAASKLCLKSEINEFPNKSMLEYAVCFGSNLTELHSHVIKDIVQNEAVELSDGRNSALSSHVNITGSCGDLVTKPLWNIVLGDVANATEAMSHVDPVSSIGGIVFFLDLCNVYEHIGDFSLSESSPFNVKEVVSLMHELNFSVMLPVSPFVNFDSMTFKTTINDRLLLNNRFENSPVLINANKVGCRDLLPGIIDFTNPDSGNWFVKNAEGLMDQYKIDYVQLMYGQSSWLPKLYSMSKRINNPGLFSTLYTNTANQISSCPLTDVAYASQSRHQFVLLKPAAGLKQTLSMALASGLAGYPFFIPNLPFKLAEVHALPSDDLMDGFIRWVQLVSFFPVMHVPWDYKVMRDRDFDIKRLTDMIKQCVLVRNTGTIGETIRTAFVRAENDRSLFLSPMWMAPCLPALSRRDYTSDKIYLIDDQFMIGRDLIFAPILEMGSRSRDVFLPPGTWARLGHAGVVSTSDGVWKTNLQVSLNDMLIFTRANDSFSC